MNFPKSGHNTACRLLLVAKCRGFEKSAWGEPGNPRPASTSKHGLTNAYALERLRVLSPGFILLEMKYRVSLVELYVSPVGNNGMRGSDTTMRSAVTAQWTRLSSDCALFHAKAWRRGAAEQQTNAMDREQLDTSTRLPHVRALLQPKHFLRYHIPGWFSSAPPKKRFLLNPHSQPFTIV